MHPTLVIAVKAARRAGNFINRSARDIESVWRHWWSPVEGKGRAMTEQERHDSPVSRRTMLKRIGVDHELALALWDTGNFDARNLAVKVVDPASMSSADLDRWAAHAAR